MPIATSSPVAGPSRRQVDSISSDGSEDEVNDEELEEEEGWTKDTFENQVINKDSPSAVAVIRQTMDRLKEVIIRLDEGLEVVKDTALALEDSKQDEPSITEVENAFFKTLDQRELLKIKVEVLETMINQLRAGQEYANIEGIFEELLLPREQAHSAKSKRAKFKNSKEYADFRSSLWEINHTTACPPVSQWLEKGADDESDDDDFDMGGQTQNYRCPITLMLFQEATTSTKCGHHYSKAAIFGLLESSRKSKRASKCPVTGCSTVLTQADLKPDPALQKRADEFNRRQKRREDEREDGDDTIAIEEDDDYE